MNKYDKEVNDKVKDLKEAIRRRNNSPERREKLRRLEVEEDIRRAEAVRKAKEIQEQETLFTMMKIIAAIGIVLLLINM